ncbi:regulatory protein, luxR family [Desulfuromusa kysingii]|uniref:Regulatory protein, luxR family n=1 Tax=Desulfuromusa kysingii TaxID=37625 RepID=A0A1H3ZRK2_9BACT|nr:helix-turn-helix transcriptional regulator [Desulfuromusa kysingii]SEA26235.1 regulatory protein, luxR family [Desulfuromusa kysingii]
MSERTCLKPEELKSLPTQVQPPCQGQSLGKDQADSQLTIQLRERVKELNCLYNLTRLIEQSEASVDQLLQGVVEQLPESWQYPEIACARICHNKQTYLSNNFNVTHWKQEAAIMISGRQEGLVEVYYTKKMPQLDEGPFLQEERLLINTVSDHLAKALERIKTQRQLQIERQALQDANAALHDSLAQSQREKKMIGASIQAKIDKIITPIFYALEAEMDVRQLKYLQLLKRNLTDIVAPFVEGHQEILTRLSPAELLICDMIKHGLSSKEIANIRGISPATVNRQRESIRSKLGLTNRKINLVSYLNSSQEE